MFSLSGNSSCQEMAFSKCLQAGGASWPVGPRGAETGLMGGNYTGPASQLREARLPGRAGQLRGLPRPPRGGDSCHQGCVSRGWGLQGGEPLKQVSALGAPPKLWDQSLVLPEWVCPLLARQSTTGI